MASEDIQNQESGYFCSQLSGLLLPTEVVTEVQIGDGISCKELWK